MPTNPVHTRWSDIEPEPMNPLLTRQLVWGDQAMISRIELKKGCIVPLHSHPNEQIAYITDGLMRFTGPHGHTMASTPSPSWRGSRPMRR